MVKAAAAVMLVALGALVTVPLASAAPVPIAASMQWRGHLPELGTRPSLRLFQTSAQYESFRGGLSDPSLFPPASRLFMSFDRDILALYVRGEDVGGRCLRTGNTASIDGDTVTLDLVWESGTCGAPITARHPFVLLSLSRTASDGTAWVQPSRSVCGAPPGVDTSACASVGGGAVASPSPRPATAAPASPSPAAASPSVTAAITPPASPATPAPTTATSAATMATPTAARTTAPPTTAGPATPAPTVALASPTPARSPDPTPRPVEVPTDDTVNYLLWGVLGLIVLFVIVAGLFARAPRR